MTHLVIKSLRGSSSTAAVLEWVELTLCTLGDFLIPGRGRQRVHQNIVVKALSVVTMRKHENILEDETQVQTQGVCVCTCCGSFPPWEELPPFTGGAAKRSRVEALSLRAVPVTRRHGRGLSAGEGWSGIDHPMWIVGTIIITTLYTSLKLLSDV